MSTLAVEETLIPLAADDFNALEQRVLRLIELVRNEREARTAAEARIHSLEDSVKSLEESGLNAEQRVISLEERLEQANGKIAQLTEERAQSAAQLGSFERERETVRTRVEKLLKQLDAIQA
jgi:chromosome segregation ATPase